MIHAASTAHHAAHDTHLRFITRRRALPTPAGLTMRDNALKANGQAAMGDLSNALR